MNIRKNRNKQNGYSLAEKSGFAAFLLAVPLGFIAPSLAALPLLLFLLTCLAAPFCPQCSFFLPVISNGRPESDAIALTIDDGPSPSSTPLLLALLGKHRLRATFFVIGEKAAAYPELIDLILGHGHTIGNHSYRHDNFLMCRSIRALERYQGDAGYSGTGRDPTTPVPAADRHHQPPSQAGARRSGTAGRHLQLSNFRPQQQKCRQSCGKSAEKAPPGGYPAPS
jgi:hypothetical protein